MLIRTIYQESLNGLSPILLIEEHCANPATNSSLMGLYNRRRAVLCRYVKLVLVDRDFVSTFLKMLLTLIGEGIFVYLFTLTFT